jgi:hypothetical protein
MRPRIVAAIVVAGLLEVRVARSDAEDPCAADVKQFCGDVKVGRGRVQECLRQNEAKLSQACGAKRTAAAAKLRGYVEAFAAACHRDADRLCAGVKPGSGRIVQCLLRQQDDLSTACQAQVEHIRTATETIATMRAECRNDVARLCASVPADAGPLVECVQMNREGLSEACRSIDPELAMESAQLVDAINATSSKAETRELAQILQGIDAIAFSRSQILLQADSYQGLGGRANADRLLFNPQVVFGSRDQFSFQLKAPVFAVFPYATDASAKTGLGAVTTSLAWEFFEVRRVSQYISMALQWISPVAPPVGAAWAVTPSYAISLGIARWFAITGQLAWIRSFASAGYPELNLLVLDPILVVHLPGRTFLALDTKLGWDLAASSFVPNVKGLVGIYVNRQKSLSISAWYQRSLSNEAALETFKFGVGLGLAYFFDW